MLCQECRDRETVGVFIAGEEQRLCPACLLDATDAHAWAEFGADEDDYQ
jgi:hypothetical protein